MDNSGLSDVVRSDLGNKSGDDIDDMSQVPRSTQETRMHEVRVPNPEISEPQASHPQGQDNKIYCGIFL